jgi:hypothetical protein
VTDDARRGPRNLTVSVSLIAAVLAAGAAVATAVISSHGNAADTRRQIKHDEATDRRDTIGAARVLAGQLVTAEVYLQGMLDTNRLIPYDGKYDVQIAQDDLKRIASAPALGVDRWQRVAAALSNLDSLEFFVRDRYRLGVRALSDREVGVFALQIQSIDSALEALAPLSGTPKLRADPFGSK